MDNTTTRRAVIASATIGTASLAVLAAPAIISHDSAIIDAWNERKAAFARYNALPFGDYDREQAEWAIIDRCEETIRSRVAATPKGVAAQIWISLQHSFTERADDEAAQTGKLDYFADDTRLDWTARLAISALRSLAAQGGAL